ncbi:MAG TPA: UDP-2,3-diacylglucosamine diphosphatase, partial [Bacteroidales bacterium]|nr:UDP-2,3-diacylglucosamine diphosphatase [Bacteroidales bacterium]
LAHLGDLGYKLLLWINKRYNQRRRRRGLPYESLSAKVKHAVKLAVNYIGDFESVMVDYARSGRYDGIICGHIHHPEIKTIQGIAYLNSGDWVESMSALAEDQHGNWTLLHYEAIIPEQGAQNLAEEAESAD